MTQNPMRFIDLGLGFSPAEISLIKGIKYLFPVWISHIWKQTAALQLPVPMLCYVSKPGFKDCSDLRQRLQEANSPVILLHHFFQRKYHKKFPLQHFPLYSGGAVVGGKVWWIVYSTVLKASSFRSQLAKQRGYELRIKFYFQSTKLLLHLLGCMGLETEGLIPQFFKSKHSPQAIYKKLLSRHKSTPTALKSNDTWILSQPFIS